MSEWCVFLSLDEVIGKVLSIMKAQGVPYTAIYTGLKPSRVSNLKIIKHMLLIYMMCISTFSAL